MMRRIFYVLAACLFIAGPSAKFLELDHADYYMIASGIGLLMITAVAIFKKKE